MSQKIAIITDSNSGITQAEAKDLGIIVLPMPFMIGEETFFEDITLTQEEFYEKLEGGADVVTSQPSPESVMNLWKETLKEYDEIVYIPMSSGLSGSCQSALMLSEDFDGKVQVVNNQRISVTQRQSAMDAKMLAERNMNAAQIKEFLENDKFNSSIYIMLDTLYYLKKGGRITPAAAAIGTILKLKPVLTIQGDKLYAFANART
ncbi:MAG: DegV family protein, partial [Lachnospiraceae bacterium]|nr:DegV family protein [Lachnospiraceae bacterium]